MKRKVKSACLVSLLWSFASLAGSTIPVIDMASILKQVEEIQALKAQIELAETQVHAIQGVTDFGQWKNTVVDLKKTSWGPSDWRSAIDRGSGLESSHYESLKDQYVLLHPALSEENLQHYDKGAGLALTQMFQEQVRHNETSQALASGGYEEVNNDFQNLHDLGMQIGDSSKDPDLKHAVDLNSRVALELGNIQVQELRMLSLLNQQWAQYQATRLEQAEDASGYLAKDDLNQG